MCKYSKEIVLQSIPDNTYRTCRFSVQDMDSKEECDNELRIWINQYPELLQVDNNKKILKAVMNWEI
jgi:hypothetical protein